MESMESTDPLPEPGDREVKNAGHPVLTVGLAYNLKKRIKSDVEDIEAEYDSIETVMAIREAIEQLGCKVELLEADDGIFEKLQKTRPHIVFNIAESTHGRGREAQIPAILSFLAIPYTGSDEATLYMAHDKALTRKILATFRLKTPRYHLYYSYKVKSGKNLRFPLIVKPNRQDPAKGFLTLRWRLMPKNWSICS